MAVMTLNEYKKKKKNEQQEQPRSSVMTLDEYKKATNYEPEIDSALFTNKETIGMAPSGTSKFNTLSKKSTNGTNNFNKIQQTKLPINNEFQNPLLQRNKKVTSPSEFQNQLREQNGMWNNKFQQNKKEEQEKKEARIKVLEKKLPDLQNKLNTSVYSAEKKKQWQTEYNKLQKEYNNLTKDNSIDLVKTAHNGLIELGKGVVDFSEGVMDSYLQFSTSKANPYYWFNPGQLKEHQDLAKEIIKRDASQEFIDNTLGYKKKLANGKTIQETLDENSLIKSDNIGGKIFRSTGRQLPSIILSGNAPSQKFSENMALALMGVDSYGSGVEEAYNNGATRGQANAYGIANAGIEMGTEKMTGGVKFFGKGSLDDVAEKGFNKIKNPLARKFLKEVYDVSGEGGEEVVSAYLNPYAKKMTYAKDKSIKELRKEEGSYGENFIMGAGGALLMKGLQAPSNVRMNNKSNIQNSSGTTNVQQNNIEETELPVLKKNDNINKNIIEENNTQVNEKNTDIQELPVREVNNIQNQETLQKRQLDKQIAPVKTEINQENVVNENTTTQNETQLLEKLKEIREQTTNKKEQAKLDDHIQQIENDVKNLSDNSKTFAQDNKTVNKYQYIESDNQKINDLRKDASNYWDNSEKTTNYVNMLEQIISDKDVGIRLDPNLTDNQGKIANGKYENGIITINPNSNRAGEFIAIHELTHAIGTDSMRNIVEKYRKSNSTFDQAINELLGKNYNTNELTEEAMADVSAQLFGNQDFINNLSQNNPSVFKKIYNEIKYLWHQFKGYNNQNQFIEDLQYKWEQAYRKNNKLNDSSNYYIENIASYDENEYNNIKQEKLANREFANLATIINNDTQITPGKNIIENIFDYETQRYKDYEIYYKDKGQFKIVKSKFSEGDSNARYSKSDDSGDATTRSRQTNDKLGNRMVENSKTNSTNDGLSNNNKGETYSERESNRYDRQNSRELENSSFSIEENNNLRDKAKEELGTTTNLNEAGYLTNDGEYLDFSGKKQGARGGQRQMDHREIADIYEDEQYEAAEKKYPNMGSNTAVLQDFLDRGNIRLNGTGVEIATAPTKEQYSELYDYLEHVQQDNGEVFIDLDTETKNRENLEYGSNTSINKMINDIKNHYNYSNNIESNTTDNQGRTLSKEQQEYFKNSKVRDEKGNLMVMYHGTPNGGFNTFNEGSYFSPNKNYASNYQDENASILKQNKGTTKKQTYEVYLNIKNPFELTNPTARDIYINEFIKGGNSGYFDSYTSYNDYVKQFSENDGFEWLEAEELKDWIKENHPEFDGLVVQEVPDNVNPDAINLAYIPFKSNQIKNINNANPTSNDDIRYSKENKTWQEYLEKEFKAKGTTTNLKDIKLPTKEKTKLSIKDVAKQEVKQIAPVKETKIQGLEHYTTNEIKDITKDYINNILEENGYDDINVKDMDIHGSRKRGTAKANSDLDVVVQYDGDIREDDFFNMLNDNGVDNLYIDGVRVDINPIQEDLSSYMKRSNAYDNEVLSKKKIAPVKETKKEVKLPVKEIPKNPTKESTYDEKAYDRKKQHEKLIKQEVKAKVKGESQKAINIATKVGQKYLELDRTQKAELKEQLSKYSGKTRKQLTNSKTWNEIKDIVNNYAEKQISYVDNEIQDIKTEIKNTKIKIDDNIKSQITDYNDFRKDNFGKLKLSKDGVSLDSMYQELSEQYPYYFNNATTEADMLYELSDFMNKDTNMYEKIKLDDATLERATTKIYNSLLQNTMNKDAINELKEEIQKKYNKRTRKIVQKELQDRMGITADDLQVGKDISSLEYQRTDPIRLHEKVFGYKIGKKINDATINFTKHQEAERIRFLNKERNEIKDLGIKPHSKESAAVQKYGEKQYVNNYGEVKKYGDAELQAEFPNTKTQQKIKHAASVIRSKYDNYIDNINEVITEMGYDPIPKRKDYMRHFMELNDKLSQWGIPLNRESLSQDALPTDINGITDQFKPGKNWFASTMQRKGLKTTYDAITGIDGYLEGASNLMYHTESIQRYRTLSKLVRETYGQTHGMENIDLSTKEGQQRLNDIMDNKLSKYAAWLDEQANALAGKKGGIDRAAERLLGRKVYSVLDTAKKQVGSNMTGFNVRSAMTNFASAVQGASKTNKLAFIKGTLSTVKNIVHNDGLINKSDFLTSRFGSDQLSKKLWQKASNAGQIFMTGSDYFTANQIWRSKYYENLSKGMTEQQAIKSADDFTARIMGDRSKGATAEIFNSKTLGLLTQFQLEVNNQWSSIIHDNKMDIKSGNKSGATAVFQLGQLAAMSYLFNNFMKSVTGSDVMIDPIDILKQIFGDDDDKTTEEKAQAVLGDLVNDLPFVSFLTGGRIPVSEAFTGAGTFTKKITGQKDRYGNPIKWEDVKNDAISSGFYWLLPTGYGQIKKTTKGVSMYDPDLPVAGSYTKTGNLRFSADESTGGKIKAALFGQYTNDEAKKYIESGYKSINSTKIDEMKELGMKSSEYRDYRSGLAQAGTKNEDKIDYIVNLDNVTNKQKNIMASNFLSRDFDIKEYNKYDSYEEYNYAYHNPEKYNLITQITSYDKYKKYNEELTEIRDNTKNDKEETIKYINSLNLSIPQKAMYIKTYYKSFKQYDKQIIQYINGKNLKMSEKSAILEKLGFTVRNGRVY